MPSSDRHGYLSRNQPRRESLRHRENGNWHTERMRLMPLAIRVDLHAGTGITMDAMGVDIFAARQIRNMIHSLGLVAAAVLHDDPAAGSVIERPGGCRRIVPPAAAFFRLCCGGHDKHHQISRMQPGDRVLRTPTTMHGLRPARRSSCRPILGCRSAAAAADFAQGFSLALSARNAASPASETSTHFLSGAASGT